MLYFILYKTDVLKVSLYTKFLFNLVSCDFVCFAHAGQSYDDKAKEANPVITIERDEKLTKVSRADILH